MISEIIKKYESFSDALIYKVSYIGAGEGNSSDRQVSITIKCMNKEKKYEWEVIKIILKGITNFRFIEIQNESSTIISNALIDVSNDGLIYIDFFPIIHGHDNFSFNPTSDFCIICKKVELETINA